MAISVKHPFAAVLEVRVCKGFRASQRRYDSVFLFSYTLAKKNWPSASRSQPHQDIAGSEEI